MKIGIIGGGQLGDLLVEASSQVVSTDKLETVIYSPLPTQATTKTTWVEGEYDDFEALAKFADQVDVITYEFESLSVEQLQIIEEQTPIYPPLSILAISQDRLHEKTFLRQEGIPTAPFMEVHSLATLTAGFQEFGACILKTRTDGYDGKGQYRIEQQDDLLPAWEQYKEHSLIVEQNVSFSRELSLICARNQQGDVQYYPLVENFHQNGILRYTQAPATDISPAQQQQAQHYANTILETHQYVGVLTLEFFETTSGLFVNEMACRVHNSGHWSIEGSQTSQFENHLRSISDQPLGTTKIKGCTTMLNIIGFFPQNIEHLLHQYPNLSFHHYGKEEREHRKIGHLTLVHDSKEKLQEQQQEIYRILST